MMLQKKTILNKLLHKNGLSNLFTDSEWSSSWFLITYYSLSSPCCFYIDIITYAYTNHFCDKNVSRIFILHLASFVVRT